MDGGTVFDHLQRLASSIAQGEWMQAEIPISLYPAPDG